MKHVRNFASVLSNSSFDDRVDSVSITVSALEVLLNFLRRDRSKTVAAFSDSFWRARDLIFSSRFYDPVIFNALFFVSRDIFSQHSVSRARSIAFIRIREAIDILERVSDRVSKFSFHRIPRGGVVLVHGCDSLIVKSLISARKRGRRFRVVLMECRPLLSGRRCASILSKAGIPVSFFVDGAISDALNSVDVVFVGGRILSSKFVLCSSGCISIAEISHFRNIPLYVFAPSWSFDFSGDFDSVRSSDLSSLVWRVPPKGVSVVAPSFDVIPNVLVSGVISDIGVFPFSLFREEVLKIHALQK